MASVQKMAICLWFDGNADDAVDFYLSIFKNSKILRTSHYGEAEFESHQRPSGSILTIDFELNGLSITALNGGPYFKLSEAASIQVFCDTQDEIAVSYTHLTLPTILLV